MQCCRRSGLNEYAHASGPRRVGSRTDCRGRPHLSRGFDARRPTDPIARGTSCDKSSNLRRTTSACLTASTA